MNKVICKKKQTVKNNAGLTAKDLNGYFSISSTDLSYVRPERKLTCGHHNRAFVDEFAVFTILDRLKRTFSGPDVFPFWFLRLAAPVFSRPLTHIYNLSLRRGEIPSQWRHALITPVAKIKEPMSVQDYRLSVTSILSRKLEHLIVTRHIYPVMLNPPADLRFDDQYAFRPTGSATAALIAIVNTVTELLRAGKTVVLISIDFSKAIDRVRHKTLFEKFGKLNLEDNIYIIGWYRILETELILPS